MDQTAFERMKRGHESWWYRGRSRIISDALIRAGVTHVGRSLDFGAGYGVMRPVLSAVSERVDAYEPEVDVAAYASRAGYATVYSTEADALANQYNIIGLFDVLEHIEDDTAQLARLHASLKAGGRLVLTVPALMFLWSRHDVENMHYRRYTRSSLVRAVEAAGFTVESVSYWNMFLFPLALTARLSGKTGESAFGLPRTIDTLFYMLIRLESALMRLVPLPIGVSLVLVAHKK